MGGVYKAFACMQIHLILKTTSGDRYHIFHYPCFTNRETQAQSSPSSRSHNCKRKTYDVNTDLLFQISSWVPCTFCRKDTDSHVWVWLESVFIPLLLPDLSYSLVSGNNMPKWPTKSVLFCLFLNRICIITHSGPSTSLDCLDCGLHRNGVHYLLLER